jgi:hypothetical protein
MADRLPLSVLGGLMTALHTDATLSAAWRERFLAPRLAMTRAVFERAIDRGEVRPAVDLAVIVDVLPSMCAFRSTVRGLPVDEAFVSSVIHHVVLPATAPGSPPSSVEKEER